MKSQRSIFIAAAAGGIVPNVVRIAITLLQGDVQIPSAGRVFTYSFGLTLMAGAGAFMAWIFDEREKKKAFYLGMGLPALLQLTFTNIDAAKSTSAAGSPAVSWSVPKLIPWAYAEPNRLINQTPRTLRVTLDAPQAGGEVIFYSRNGRQKLTQEVTNSPETLAVPDFADHCTLRYRDAVSAPATLSATVTEVHATIEENHWGGFWQAIGSTQKPAYKILLK